LKKVVVLDSVKTASTILKPKRNIKVVKNVIVTLLALFFSTLCSAQSFEFAENDSAIVDLKANKYTEIKLDINNLTFDTLKLAIEVLSKDLPDNWDGMVCVHGMCLGVIPEIGEGEKMSPIVGNEKAYVRLTVNPFNNLSKGELQIRVYNVNNPSDADTAVWILNSTVSISERRLTEVQCYPNPATDVITIKGLIPLNSIKLIDYSGKIVHLQNFSDPYTGQRVLKLPPLNDGVYLLSTYNDGILTGQRKLVIANRI
jgi:hypothetical protein